MRSFEADFRREGGQAVSVRTVNLNQDWQDIERTLTEPHRLVPPTLCAQTKAVYAMKRPTMPDTETLPDAFIPQLPCNLGRLQRKGKRQEQRCSK